MTYGTQYRRDIAITDFRFAMRAGGVLTDRSGRSYLIYDRIERAPARPTLAVALDDDISGASRRLADWALCTLCAVFYSAAIWFAFFTV
ncbi:MAG TPA: hypothetical protein VGC72_00790 [Candidatus Elarobacter sp.]